MKLSLRPLVLATLAVACGLDVHATSAPAATRHPPTRTLSPILAVLDADRDGTLSAHEIAMAPMRLAALDLNDDGLISPSERRTTNAEGQPVRAWHGATAANIVLTLDANQDGDLQWLEITNAVSSLKRLDLNGDGMLTPDELRPATFARVSAAAKPRA